jgi:hypothetical protein
MCSDKISEVDLMRLIQLKASEVGARLWRNNVGTAYTIDTVKKLIKAALSFNFGAIKLAIRELRFIKFGLIEGSSDLIGIYKGRFLAVEVKIKGKKPTAEQINFVDFINKSGGIAGVCYSIQDFLDLLQIND